MINSSLLPSRNDKTNIKDVTENPIRCKVCAILFIVSPLFKPNTISTLLALHNIKFTKDIRKGEDITVVSYGSTLRIVDKACDLLEEHNINIDLIDIQSII